jgi:poly(A) polymerase/tRNA nucleotidyltransferase (CCA-adding enzyme)
MTWDILERLRFSRADRDRVVHLVEEHMFHYTKEWSDAAVRRFLRRVGPENVADLFELRVADDRAHGTGPGDRSDLDELGRRIKETQERDHALKVGDLAVDGRDLMQLLGIEPGPEVGRILEGLLDQVLEDPSLNEREKLLAMARRIKESS